MPAECDLCHRKGSCCSGFHISYQAEGKRWAIGRYWAPTPLHALVFSAERGMPFLLSISDEDGEWRFDCPLLGEDGRCTDYERRPQVCRNYEPGQDGLCALYVENLEGLA